MVHKLLALLVTMTVVFVARGALAYDIDAPKGSFHLTLASSQGLMCVVWPTGHTDKTACAGLDVTQFEKLGSMSKAATVQSVALVRDGDVKILVMVLEQDQIEDSELTPSIIDQYAKGAAKGMRERLVDVDVSVDDKRRVDLNGVPAADVRMSAKFPTPSPLEAIFTHTRYFEIPTSGASYTVMFTTGPTGVSKLDALSDKVMGTLSANKPTTHTKSLFGDDDEDDKTKEGNKTKHGSHSDAFRNGEAVGRIIGYAAVFGLVGFVIWRATRRSPPRPQPWNQQAGWPTHQNGPWPPRAPGQWPPQDSGYQRGPNDPEGPQPPYQQSQYQPGAAPQPRADQGHVQPNASQANQSGQPLPQYPLPDLPQNPPNGGGPFGRSPGGGSQGGGPPS